MKNHQGAPVGFVRSPKELALLVMSQRKMLKLSQAAIGDLVGLRQKTISGFENKPESTQLDTLFRILSALNLELTISAKDKPLQQDPLWKEEW